MNTRLVMTLSAITLMALGAALNFIPEEGYHVLSNSTAEPAAKVLMQLLGALLFAFGMVNWTARGNLIGGIYARPIAIGNVTHFVIGSLTLIKGSIAPGNPFVSGLTVYYLIFAAAFGYIMMTHPIKENSKSAKSV